MWQGRPTQSWYLQQPRRYYDAMPKDNAYCMEQKQINRNDKSVHCTKNK